MLIVCVCVCVYKSIQTDSKMNANWLMRLLGTKFNLRTTFQWQLTNVNLCVFHKLFNKCESYGINYLMICNVSFVCMYVCVQLCA